MVKHIQSFLLLAILVVGNSLVQGAEFFKPVPAVFLSLTEVWQRQEVIVTIMVETPDEFARLEADEYSYSNFGIHEIPFERVKTDEGKYIVKIGWVLFPLVEGEYGIELTDVFYKPNSGRKIRLKIPYQELKVKPLPTYIPATMPVGKVMITNAVKTDRKIHDTENLINWNIALTTNSVLPETIPPILRQVKTTDALDVFPVTTDKKITPTFQGIINNNNYDVPVKALRSGFLDLPTLSVQYFDPEDAKLKRITSQPLNHWVINRYLQWFFLGLMLLGALLVLIKLFKIMQAYLLKRRMIRQAINAIEQANNTEEVRTALHSLSQAKGWEANATLQKLLKNWESQKGQDLVLDSLFNELQAVQFSKNTKPSFESVKIGLINTLKRA